MDVISVSQLNEYIRQYLDDNVLLSGLAVCGEIIGFKRHSSGHMYFSLKDQDSILQCSFFRGDNFRLNFIPQDGLQVVVLGRPTIYSKQGKYHFVVRQMLQQGSGDAAARLEELKKKLLNEGLFDSSRKRRIPLLPKRIGVVTSQTGAVFHDILNVTHKRAPMVDILLSPVAVQGMDAPKDIIRGLKEVQMHDVDVVIIGRGGGSAEELSCFNDEMVVRAVAECRVPVISAVGHETDVTLCDLAADVRAATPSQAAEFAVADTVSLRREFDQRLARMEKVIDALYLRSKDKIDAFSNHYLIRQPEILMEQASQELDDINEKLQRIIDDAISTGENTLSNACGKLDVLSPLKVLARGYSVVYDDNGTVTDATVLNSGQSIKIKFAKGSTEAVISEVFNS